MARDDVRANVVNCCNSLFLKTESPQLLLVSQSKKIRKTDQIKNDNIFPTILILFFRHRSFLSLQSGEFFKTVLGLTLFTALACLA